MLAESGGARRGRLHARARRRRDAGVHAGRHARRHQGRHAGSGRRRSAPTSFSANTYHLHCGRATKRSRARAACMSSSAGRKPNPDRLRWLPGLQSGRPAHRVAKTASSSSRIWTAARCSLSPESAADIQARLGSDIAMVFDECTTWPVDHDEAAAAPCSARCAGRAARAIGSRHSSAAGRRT